MKRIRMKCQNCGSENLGMMIDVAMSMDFDKYMNLHKTDLRKADVKIWGVDWAEADIICKKCGHLVKAGKSKQELRKDLEGKDLRKL